MAVLSTLLGLTAEVLVNGVTSHEYEDEDEINIQHDDATVREYQAARTISKYIKSVTGERFSLKFTVGPPLGNTGMIYTKLLFRIYIDGLFVWQTFCARPDFKKMTEWEDEIDGLKEGKGRECTKKEFIFAAIETNSESAETAVVQRQAQRLQKKGLIEVKVYHGDYGRLGGNTKGTSKGFLEKDGTTVSEKSLKGQAKSHGTGLGDAKSAKRGRVVRSKLKDGEDYPIAIFRFMYRSQESLKQLYIIPRTPSPSPEPSPEPEEAPAIVNGLTAEQQRQIEQMVQQFANQNRQANSGGERPSRVASRIKREHMEERSRSSSLGSSSRGPHCGSRAAKKQVGRNGKPKVIVIPDDHDDE